MDDSVGLFYGGNYEVQKILTGFVAALMLSGAIGAPVTAKATTHYGGWRTHQKIVRVALVN